MKKITNKGFESALIKLSESCIIEGKNNIIWAGHTQIN